MLLCKRQSEFTLKMNTSQDISLDPHYRLALSQTPAIRWEGQQGGCKLNNVETAVSNFSFVFPYTARFD